MAVLTFVAGFGAALCAITLIWIVDRHRHASVRLSPLASSLGELRRLSQPRP